jgi:NCAIR mutase (PurE)-related protein
MFDERRLIKIVEEQTETIEKLVEILDRLTKHERVNLVFTQNLNNTKSIIMLLSLNSNQSSVGLLGLIDSDTQAQVSATFANVSFSGSNPAAFSVTQDTTNPNQANVAGVAAGTGTISATADATYTDSTTGQSVTKTGLTVSVDVTVLAIVAGENVTLQLNFSTPTP